MIHFVSLGPGDPELITLKALRTLREADYIYTPVPVSRKGRHASKAAEMMLSLGIREEQIQLYDLPMSKDRDGALEAYEIVAREACEKQKAEPNARIAIVAEGGPGEVVAPLDHAVTDRHDIGLRQAGALLLQQAQDLGQSEAVVREASESGISTVILRPRGIVGVGDTSIVPRLLEANRTMGIPLFRGGHNVVDLIDEEHVIGLK